MRFLSFPSSFSIYLLAFSLFATSGCIRKKVDEPEASSPTAPQNPNPGELADIDPGETFQVKFETSKGDFIVEAYSGWAPLGAARFKELVTSGFYDGCRFFRIVPGFIVQWGINGDPEIQKKWVNNKIPDDKVLQKNVRGTLSFATSGPGSRTVQLFINYADNTLSLNSQGFSPFAKVIEGMDVVDALNAEYGEEPDQGQIQTRGNAYLNKEFPNLDYIIKATIIDPATAKIGKETQNKKEPKTETRKPAEGEKVVKEDSAKEEKAAPGKEPAAKKKESSKPETIEEIK